MTILIDGMVATLAEDMSFEYVSENRLFTDADDFTLSLTFPLAGCSGNMRIFGNINRADVIAGRVVFDCVMQDPRLVKTGALVITEINENEVTAQFLSGRSAFNFDTTLDDVFINEINLGVWPHTKTDIGVTEAWNPNSYQGQGVALPWVNNASGNIQNCFVKGEDGSLKWHDDTQGLSWQPYLIDIAFGIVNAIDYTADFSDWLNHPTLKWLLVCNTLPYAWGIEEFARALPHWSVKEFFANIEPLLGAEFEFDHKAKTVTMVMLRPWAESSANAVALDRVLSEHSTEISAIDEESEYRGVKNIVFADRNDTDWKYESCDWYIRANKGKAVRFATLAELMQKAKELRTWDGTSGHRATPDIRHKLLYAEDVDAYFVLRAIDKQKIYDYWPDRPNIYRYTLMLQPVNMLAGRIADTAEDAPELKLEIVPVRKDYTGVYTGYLPDQNNEENPQEDYGRMMFLEPASYGEESPELDGVPAGESIEDYIRSINEKFYQTGEASAIENGKKESLTEYYDKLFLGYWDGTKKGGMINPVPVTARFEPNDQLSVVKFPYSLNPGDAVGPASDIYANLQIGVKRTFKFLTHKLPDVRATFLIRGKKYLCGKISATFTHSGMSELVTGEFYPFADDSAD